MSTTPPAEDNGMGPVHKIKVAIVTTVTAMETATTTAPVTPDVDATKDEVIRTMEGAVLEEHSFGLTVTAPIPAGTLILKQRVTKALLPSQICKAAVRGIVNDGVGRYIA